MTDFDSWCARALATWHVHAPSYVRVDVTPTRNTLRNLFDMGATIEQFDEALEAAFASKTVTKRQALYYAYGIVKRLVSEAR